MKSDFLKKIEKRDITIAVIGLGYVGLPLAEAYIRQNIKTIGFDVNEKRVKVLRSGVSGMDHISDERVQTMNDSGLFSVTANPEELKKADALLICVPTPLDNYHHPDLTYVTNSCETLSKVLRCGQLVALESTTYPGTTEDVVKPILEKSGLSAGKDFALAYSPEREDPGNATYETSTIPKLVGANTQDELKIADAVYSLIVDTVPVNNCNVAEAAKLTENIFRWVNIGLANELKLIFDKMNINIWDVVKAADSKPFGFMAFYPGPGVGGHCIRIDPYYLTWKAREFGLSTRFIELAGEINIAMPGHVINKTMVELNLRFKKSLGQCRILLVGMAYKRDISDFRESPSLNIFQLLIENGADVDYFDPHIPMMENVHGFPKLENKRSIPFEPNTLQSYDCAIISTDHKNVNYNSLVENIPLVIDTRNCLENLPEHLKLKTALA